VNKTKKVTEVCCYAIIFCFFFLASQYVLKETIFSDNQNLTPTANAFLGAFFAFLFVRIGDLFSDIYKRRKRHYTALVRLEYFLNECFVQHFDNINVIDGFISLIDETKDKSVIPFYANTFHPIEFDKNILLDLANIGLINEVAELFCDFKRANSDMATSTKIYNELKEGLIQKTISRVDFKQSVLYLAQRLAELKKFFINLDSKMERNCAVVRLLLEDKMLWKQAINKCWPNSFPSEHLIREEMKKLSDERQQNIDKSKKEIEQILKGV